MRAPNFSVLVGVDIKTWAAEQHNAAMCTNVARLLEQNARRKWRWCSAALVREMARRGTYTAVEWRKILLSFAKAA